MSDEKGGSSGPTAPDQYGAQDDVCEYCGDQIDTSAWHPITKEREPDGSLQLSPFCSEDCQEAWLGD